MDSPQSSPGGTFQSVQDNMGYAIRGQLLLLDSSLSVKAASKSFYTTFRVTPEQTLGRELRKLGSGQWNIPTLTTLLQTLPTGNGGFDDFEVECDFPTLGQRRMSVSARLISNDNPHSGMIVLSIGDAPARKPSEVWADEPRPQFRTTLASIADAVIVTDLESRITFMNPAAERLTGWNKCDALYKPLTQVFDIVNEQSVRTQSPAEKAIQTGEAVGLSENAILIARDGSKWPIDDSACLISDVSGRFVAIVLVFHDISNRRKAEQELEFSEVRYRRLFEAAHDGVLILDATTAKVVDANPFIGELLGYPSQHFLGKELWEIGVFKDAESSKDAMATLQKVGSIRYEDHPLQHKDGRHIPVEFVSNVYREGNREVIQCNIRDITERRRLADELTEAREHAEAANRSKSEFLANMSHEIRTPMSAIVGFADTLLKKSPDECKEIGCVQIIRRNALHLMELINDILDLSKVEAGQMTVESIPCDLPAMLSEIVSLIRPRAIEKGLGFGVTFTGSIPRLIQTDPLRFRQILVNLLGNAMKFTESGKIDVRVMEEGTGGPNIVLRVDVIDSGIGMLPEQTARLFRPFTQGDASITRRFGGTGLGLTISQQLAKLLGGEVTVVSQLGIGSTFTLRVDGGPSAGVEGLTDLTEARLPRTVDGRTKAEIYLRGRILLVEDGADNQRLLRMQLSSAGGSVVGALNGQIGVDLATTQPFDLILMDMQMPIMDGYAATTELRRRGLKIPIIALTAYAMSEDRDKCLASGCDSYLSKPVQEETLLTAVAEYLGRSVPQESSGTIVGPPPAVTGGSGPIKSTLADDPRMMDIIPGYVKRLPDKVRKMLDLLKNRDLVTLQQVVHELLGAAGGYGFEAVSAPARKAQESMRAGADLEPITAEIKLLIDVVRRIEGYDESNAPISAGKSEK